MNLTNFHDTPIARVVEIIRREAERYGVAIHHSELVGLIPQEALVDAAVWYTQLDGFSPEQILESRLFSETSASTPAQPQPVSFIEELASPTPTPGGGSAGAYAGAMGAGLVAMVSGLTIGKKKYAEVEAEMHAIRVMAEKLRKELTQAVDDDASSFEVLMARKAASSTPAGEPAKVSTVRLWSRSEERSRSLTSLTDWMAATIWSMTSGRRASEKLGMHSMS